MGGAGDLVQAFQKKWLIKSDFTARQTPSPFPLWFSVPRDESRISGNRGCIELFLEVFFVKNHIFSSFRGGGAPPPLNPSLVPVVTTIGLVRRCY